MQTRALASDLERAGLVVAGRYRLDAMLGQGGMGSVWAATHLGLGSAVAIKLISRELVRSPEALRRFDAEAKAIARLTSRHVVQVFDNGTLDDGTPYIAMELLRGESLHARVHRAGPVPLAEAVHILSQCCKALGRAHAAGIVHRDVKPDNIFLAESTDDDGAVVKVLDFGIAKVVQHGEGEGVGSSTRTGAVLGTPLYMSPEQARGLKGVDHRTDLYSLGLVAYTMLTGNLAFSSESFGDLLYQICTQPLPSLCAAAPWLPPAMDAWFSHVCAREPAQRCPSAQDFLERLQKAAGLAAPSGSHSSAPALVEMAVAARRPPPSARRVVALVGAAIALALLTAAALFWRARPAGVPAIDRRAAAATMATRDVVPRRAELGAPDADDPGPPPASTGSASTPAAARLPPAMTGPPSTPASTASAAASRPNDDINLGY